MVVMAVKSNLELLMENTTNNWLLWADFFEVIWKFNAEDGVSLHLYDAIAFMYLCWEVALIKSKASFCPYTTILESFWTAWVPLTKNKALYKDVS